MMFATHSGGRPTGMNALRFLYKTHSPPKGSPLSPCAPPLAPRIPALVNPAYPYRRAGHFTNKKGGPPGFRLPHVGEPYRPVPVGPPVVSSALSAPSSFAPPAVSALSSIQGLVVASAFPIASRAISETFSAPSLTTSVACSTMVFSFSTAPVSGAFCSASGSSLFSQALNPKVAATTIVGNTREITDALLYLLSDGHNVQTRPRTSRCRWRRQ
jgi:hypothetical protein